MIQRHGLHKDDITRHRVVLRRAHGSLPKRWRAQIEQNWEDNSNDHRRKSTHIELSLNDCVSTLSDVWRSSDWSTVAASVWATGAIGPSVHPPEWGARRPELVQAAGAIDAHYEHSEVRTAKWLGSFFLNELLIVTERPPRESISHIHVQRHWVVAQRRRPRNVRKTKTSVIPLDVEVKANGMEAWLFRSFHTDKGPNGGNYDARTRGLKCREVCLNGEKAETLHDNAGYESVEMFIHTILSVYHTQLLQSTVTEWYIKKMEGDTVFSKKKQISTFHKARSLGFVESCIERSVTFHYKKITSIEFKSRSLVSRDAGFSKSVEVGQFFVARPAVVLEGEWVTTTWRDYSHMRDNPKVESKRVLGDNTIFGPMNDAKNLKTVWTIVHWSTDRFRWWRRIEMLAGRLSWTKMTGSWNYGTFLKNTCSQMPQLCKVSILVSRVRYRKRLMQQD